MSKNQSLLVYINQKPEFYFGLLSVILTVSFYHLVFLPNIITCGTNYQLATDVIQ